MKAEKTYNQILKTSSIMGGSAGIIMLLGMLRIKLAAVIIGSIGVGLLAGFTAIQGFIGTVAGLGIQSSAVREIATAVGKGDEQSIGRIILTLSRVCWISGLLGMVIIMALSPVLSKLTFKSTDYTLDIAALGIVILLSNLAGGQLALLQGMRRIGDMARANVIGSIFATMFAIGFYYWLGLRGIVPSLIGIGVTHLTVSWYFARRISVPEVTLTCVQTYREAKAMVSLGLVFMFNGLMLSLVSYFTITLIAREIDLHAVGLYSAAFALSGIFVNFVLGAMGADYYPRLVSLVHDKIVLNRIVNEQTEIGLLLALPGLLATMTLAPWILEIFYTREFLGAVELLQWFVLGCLCRVISWPLGFVIIALGKARWYLITETIYNFVHFALVFIFLNIFGIEGVAIAFFIASLSYISVVNLVCGHLTGFKWSTGCLRIVYYTSLTFVIAFIILRALSGWPAIIIGITISLVMGFFCLREIAQRIGPESRFVKIIELIPNIKSIFNRK
jgi:antigen flippase